MDTQDPKPSEPLCWCKRLDRDLARQKEEESLAAELVAELTKKWFFIRCVQEGLTAKVIHEVPSETAIKSTSKLVASAFKDAIFPAGLETTITVDGSLIASTIIPSLSFTPANRRLCEKNLTRSLTPMDIQVKVFHFDVGTGPAKAFAAIDLSGYRPASMMEILAFYGQHPTCVRYGEYQCLIGLRTFLMRKTPSYAMIMAHKTCTELAFVHISKIGNINYLYLGVKKETP